MSTLLTNDYTWWMTPEQKAADEARAKLERATRDKFERRIRKAIEDAAPIMAEWGDGNGGAMSQIFEQQMALAGATRPHSGFAEKRKAKISRQLSKAVFERDGYRCVQCNSHVDLSCDHIISEHDGGATTLDNLQTMCRPCNSSKGKKSFSVLRGKAA